MNVPQQGDLLEREGVRSEVRRVSVPRNDLTIVPSFPTRRPYLRTLSLTQIGEAPGQYRLIPRETP
ncbi:hypothetical protein GCM10008957_30550 [Deinococcus ruber]|uniref:Uncharacterized protein n=1 Tax=Deinococcus ruber TaxID=1848197 RepID=A0A918F8J2_9DEIO|nr:hypothetical protein GCM10008957_30550 [Deinococcus ruber]